MEETRVKAPRKSTRFSLGQRSPVEDFGSWSTKATADIAIAVSGTWRKKDLMMKLGDYLIEYKYFTISNRYCRQEVHLKVHLPQLRWQTQYSIHLARR